MYDKGYRPILSKKHSNSTLFSRAVLRSPPYCLLKNAVNSGAIIRNHAAISVQELVACANVKPGVLDFAPFGTGASSHPVENR